MGSRWADRRMGLRGGAFFLGLAGAVLFARPAWCGSAVSTVPAVPTVVKVAWPKLSNAERSFVLPYCMNCRQLGGLPARGGFIKLNRLYRTDGLFRVDDPYLPKIEALGWRVVIDLRTPSEWRDEGYDNLPRVFWWHLWKPRCRNVFLPMTTCHDGPEDVPPYRVVMTENNSSMAEFFNTLARASNYPLAFHCSAGKDRTGVTAALLLELLGTPRPVIYADFLYSRHNHMEVNADDLAEVFAIIDEQYNGSVRQYLEAIGVRKSKLDRIPELLIDRSGA